MVRHEHLVEIACAQPVRRQAEHREVVGVVLRGILWAHQHVGRMTSRPAYATRRTRASHKAHLRGCAILALTRRGRKIQVGVVLDPACCECRERRGE